MRIRIVNPVVRGVLDEGALPPLPAFVRAEVDWLEEGPSSIECRYDEARCVPAVLERVRAAAAAGVDGIVLNCFMDPALQPARELVRVPIAGPAQSSMALAVTLGQTFSVILPAASGAPIVADQASAYVGRDRLASVRSVEMPVAELHDHDRLLHELVEQARLAVEHDGAQVVILGCTGMCGVTAAFKRSVEQLGLGVPVIDPTLAAVGAIVTQSIATVTHAERAYALPSWRAMEVV
jgi:allantoin racemase